MKTYAIMITLFWGLTSIAQSDTISDCAKYKSLYYQYLKQGMYTDAAFFWDQAYEACLAANELDYKIYKNGKVLNYQLRSSLSPSDSIRYQALTDSIVWIYDEGLDVVREQQWKYDNAVKKANLLDYTLNKYTTLFPNATVQTGTGYMSRSSFTTVLVSFPKGDDVDSGSWVEFKLGYRQDEEYKYKKFDAKVDALKGMDLLNYFNEQK